MLDFGSNSVSAFSICLFRNLFSSLYLLWSCFVELFSSRMSWALLALNKYFIRVTTLVIVSMSPKFSMRIILPISLEGRASNGSRFGFSSSGFCFANWFAKSGIYASPMHPIVASHRSSERLKIFCAMYVVGSAIRLPSTGRPLRL